MRRFLSVAALLVVLSDAAPAMTLGVRMAIWNIAPAQRTGAGFSDVSDALDAADLEFVCCGDAEWSVVDDETAVGGHCARSGVVGDSQSSWVETQVTGPGTASFLWKVSSQARLDTLSFWIDGVRKASVAGERDWFSVSFDVAGDGVHVLRWTYAKSASGSSGEDCGWLDNVQWSPGLAEITLGTALDSPDLDWSTGGNDTGEWTAVASPSWDGVDACVAHADGVGGVARLSTHVNGPGLVSFRWKIAAGTALSGIAFMVDGADVEICDSETWSLCTLSIAGSGRHCLAWEFFWDGEPDGDAGFLDCVSWTPVPAEATETSTTPEPVPYSWLSDHAATILAVHGGDYEAAAMAPSANRVNKVWECYVAGISPTNAAGRFEARIEIENGVPVVTWSPDLNEGGTKRERVYTVEGKERLGDGWGPTNAASRFFRVKVGMP